MRIEPMDDLNKGLFTFASYNAGPGRIASLRREAARRGLNQNVWFGKVEQVASEKIGRETVTYVSNISKYYIAYKLVVEEPGARAGLGDCSGVDFWDEQPALATVISANNRDSRIGFIRKHPPGGQ